MTPGAEPEITENTRAELFATTLPIAAGSVRVMPLQRQEIPEPKTSAKSPGPDAIPSAATVDSLTLNAQPALSMGAEPSNSSSFPATGLGLNTVAEECPGT